MGSCLHTRNTEVAIRSRPHVGVRKSANERLQSTGPHETTLTNYQSLHGATRRGIATTYPVDRSRLAAAGGWCPRVRHHRGAGPSAAVPGYLRDGWGAARLFTTAKRLDWRGAISSC